MTTDFTEIHGELRSVAADLLAKGAAGGTVPWPLMAQAGWTGLEVPDGLGGAGATFAETAIVCTELGRAAGTSAYLGSAVLAVDVLNRLGSSEFRDQLLAGVADGSSTAAAVIGVEHETNSPTTAFTIEVGDYGWRLSGAADFIPDADRDSHLLVLADGPRGDPVVVVVPPGADGVDIVGQPVVDQTRRLARVAVTALPVQESAVWRFTTARGHPVGALLDRAAVAVACDSLGLSEAMLTATVDYVGIRQQFGRAIGSFQAVKHACADMLVQISVARQLIAAAVDALAQGRDDAGLTTARAKAYACQCAVDVAGKAMQLHGGIGYTWDSGIHVYLKRAALNRSLFGSPAAHRRRIAVSCLEKDLVGDVGDQAAVDHEFGAGRE